MDEKEFKRLRKVVENYKTKKDEIYNQIAELDKKQREGKQFPWQIDEQKNELYLELAKSSEREAFSKELKKIDNDADFEKHFRSLALECFLHIKIAPENLD